MLSSHIYTHLTLIPHTNEGMLQFLFHQQKSRFHWDTRRHRMRDNVRHEVALSRAFVEKWGLSDFVHALLHPPPFILSFSFFLACTANRKHHFFIWMVLCNCENCTIALLIYIYIYMPFTNVSCILCCISWFCKWFSLSSLFLSFSLSLKWKAKKCTLAKRTDRLNCLIRVELCGWLTQWWEMKASSM